MEQNDFINAMSEADIREQLEKYKDNPSVVTLLEGVLEARVREVAEAKAKAKFEKGIANLFKNLPHPEDVHNVYVRWGEVDVPTGEPDEEVEVVNDDGTKTKEMRTPSTKQHQWIVQVNHIVTVSRGSDGKDKVSKRAITIYKREGLALENKGNYASASKACEALGLTIGGDSATRVLAREAYIVEPFTGELTS